MALPSAASAKTEPVLSVAHASDGMPPDEGAALWVTPDLSDFPCLRYLTLPSRPQRSLCVHLSQLLSEPMPPQGR